MDFTAADRQVWIFWGGAKDCFEAAAKDCRLAVAKMVASSSGAKVVQWVQHLRWCDAKEAVTKDLYWR